jgi:cell division protein FtsW (lipid II flippase)
MLFMGLLCVVFLVCSLKTDLAHVVVFLTLILAFAFLTGQHFHIALGHASTANKLQVVRSHPIMEKPNY